MGESPEVIFDRMVDTGPAEGPERLFGTACVLGGSIGGLFAARVLAGYAERVVIIDWDAIEGATWLRRGVPQGSQMHIVLAAGQQWMDRWFPGLIEEMRVGGAVLARPEQIMRYLDGQEHAGSTSPHPILQASRPFIEAHIRDRVLALPNVSVLRSRVTGLDYEGDSVRGVRHRGTDRVELLPADFVVDAMGRSSRLPDWLGYDGFDRPVLERLPTEINYATALFKRPPERAGELTYANVNARYGSPPYGPDSVAIAGLVATENDRWTLVQMTYGDVRPGHTLDAFRATCAKLPPLFGEAAGQGLAEEIASFYQGDTRRRHFIGLKRFPARLVSVGDAVASFSPVYAQGISSAALHASCLAEYLSSGPELHRPATRFFELQRVVVDAAWAVSADVDAARLDALSGAEVPEEVSRKRDAMKQMARAALSDPVVGRRFLDVTSMLAHPGTLADPALLERAITVNHAPA